MAEGHKKSGLREGHQYYRRISNQAWDKITNYTVKYGGTREDIAMDMPKLAVLSQLADGKPSTIWPRVVGVVIATLVISFYLGIMKNVFDIGAHLHR